MVKWDPGPKQLEKGSPNTQNKLTLFHKKTMFFLGRFFFDFMQCSGDAFLWFWWPKCPKWGAIGKTFPDILMQSWKVEMYGCVYTKHYFSWFLGVGFGNVGHLFSSGFLNWIRGGIFWFFVRFRLQPGTQMLTFGHHFPYKLKVDFLMNFRGVRVLRLPAEMVHRGSSLKLFS